MAGIASNGSPELRGRASAQFIIHDEADETQNTLVGSRQSSSVSVDPASVALNVRPLTSKSGLPAEPQVWSWLP